VMGMLYCESAVLSLHCCMCLHDQQRVVVLSMWTSIFFMHACLRHSRPAAGLTEDDGIDDGNGPNGDLTRRAEGCIDDDRHKGIVQPCKY
jgi:hypothetical protein